jgi:hypothetical protein
VQDQARATTIEREPLAAPERARWELAAMAGRMRNLEARLAESQQYARALRKDRDRLRRSESYRIGSGLVALAKNPVRTIPRLIRALLRQLRSPQVVPPPAVKAPVASQRLPVHLYVVIGLDAQAVREFVLTLRQRLVVNPDHRPVVVTDNPSFALLRHLGVLLEFLPDRATWERHRPDQAWDDVLARRLSRLYRDHDSVRTVIVDRSQPPTLADLLR